MKADANQVELRGELDRAEERIAARILRGGLSLWT